MTMHRWLVSYDRAPGDTIEEVFETINDNAFFALHQWYGARWPIPFVRAIVYMGRAQ